MCVIGCVVLIDLNLTGQRFGLGSRREKMEHPFPPGQGRELETRSFAEQGKRQRLLGTPRCLYARRCRQRTSAGGDCISEDSGHRRGGVHRHPSRDRIAESLLSSLPSGYRQGRVAQTAGAALLSSLEGGSRLSAANGLPEKVGGDSVRRRSSPTGLFGALRPTFSFSKLRQTGRSNGPGNDLGNTPRQTSKQRPSHLLPRSFPPTCRTPLAKGRRLHGRLRRRLSRESHSEREYANRRQWTTR